MQLGEACLLKLEKWVGLSDKLSIINRNDLPAGGLMRKQRKYIKKWKKSKQLQVHKDKNCLTLAAYTTADRYNLERVLRALKTQRRYTACELTNDAPLATDLGNAVHLKSIALNGTEDSHVFCFDVGAVVMWNLTHGQREEMLAFLKLFEENPYGFKLSQSSLELLSYKYVECRSSYLHDNILYFGVAEKNQNVIGLNRFLISSAISFAAKVGALETMVEKHLGSMGNVAARIKAGKGLGIKQREVLKIAGVTYSTKHHLKQASDSLLMPCNILKNLQKSDDERESFANVCIYYSLRQRLEMFEDNMVLCEYYINLLLNQFSYHRNIRYLRIMLGLVGMVGASIVYIAIKSYMS